MSFSIRRILFYLLVQKIAILSLKNPPLLTMKNLKSMFRLYNQEPKTEYKDVSETLRDVYREH